MIRLAMVWVASKHSHFDKRAFDPCDPGYSFFCDVIYLLFFEYHDRKVYECGGQGLSNRFDERRHELHRRGRQVGCEPNHHLAPQDVL